MSEEGIRQFFNPLPPQQSIVVGRGTTVLYSGVAPQKEQIQGQRAYKELFGRLVELIAVRDIVWVSTSTDGLTSVSRPADSGGAATLAAGTALANGRPIIPGAPPFVCHFDGNVDKFLHWVSDSSDAVLIIRPWSPNRLSEQDNP